MANSIGRTIKLFLIDGAPDGMLTAEIMNWTGHVLYGPRARIVDLLRRPEVQKTGIYLLVGTNPEEADGLLVYVGEGDNVGARLTTHDRDEQKDFWEYVCVVTSKDLNLTKGHVRYLESRMIAIIKSEGRAKLANKSAPEFDLLPEADRSDMEEFLSRLQVLLPVLGLGFVRPTPQIRPTVHADTISQIGDDIQGHPLPTPTRTPSTQQRPTAEGGSSPPFSFRGGIAATAVEVGGQMVILEGSLAKQNVQSSIGSNIRALREQLMRAGKLIASQKPGFLEFTSDVPFASPSAAAQAVAGTSRNGREDWVTREGQSYAKWQEMLIAEAKQAPTSDAALGEPALETHTQVP